MAKQHNQPYRLYKRGEIYHAYISFISETGERIKLRESTGRMAESDAIKYCIKRITEINQKSHRIANGELEPITIADAFTRYFKEKGQYQANPKDLLYRLNNIRLLLNITYLHELDKETINNYVTQRRKTAKNSTINRDLAILSAVRNLADEFWEVKVNTAKPLKFKLKEPAENIKFLKDWEIAQRIVDNASPHLKPIIDTALYTGLRQSNILALKWSDVDFKNNGVKVHRKGGAEVIVYFGEEVHDALLEYQIERQGITPVAGSENAFFLSLQNRRISVRAVENLVKKYSKLVTNLKNITPHKLRSTYGTALYKETGDIYLVADVLGHKDVNTTRKHYAAIEDERRKMAAQYVNLRGNKN